MGPSITTLSLKVPRGMMIWCRFLELRDQFWTSWRGRPSYQMWDFNEAVSANVAQLLSDAASMLQQGAVMDFLLHKHKFQSCDYCMEGWFGTCVPKSAMPGGFESQTYKKMNFLLVYQNIWRETLVSDV